MATRSSLHPTHRRASAPDALSPEFAELYERYWTPVVHLCRRVLGGHGDAEAVAQEAFVRAWLARNRFIDGRPVWPWLATIARRACIDYQRRFGRELDALRARADAHEPRAAVPDLQVEIAERNAAAMDALRRLRPAQQRLIMHRDLNGWTYEDIAQFEGVSVESVRGSLKRARTALRHAYRGLTPGALVVVPGRAMRWVQRKVAAAWHPCDGGVPSRVLPARDHGELALRVLTVVLGLTVTLTPPGPAPREGNRTPGAPVPPGVEAQPASSAPSPAAVPLVDVRPAMRDRPAPQAEGAAPPKGEAAVAPHADEGASAHVSFLNVTPSPSYESDGTVFASGYTAGCPVNCAVVFRSTDRGHTWRRLAAEGFLGGHLLLSPGFASDRQMFAFGLTGLQLSDDGGGSFRTVATAPLGQAAISPGFARGDPRVVFGAMPGWEYRHDVGVMRPGGFLLPSGSVAGNAVFAPGEGDEPLIVVGGTTVSGTRHNANAVFVCRSLLCDAPAVLQGLPNVPAYVYAPDIATSPDFAVDQLAFAWARELFVSRDGARSFEPVPLPVRDVAMVLDVAPARNGAALVSVLWVDEETQFRGSLLRTGDGGRTWTIVDGIRHPVTDVELLSDGRILAVSDPNWLQEPPLLCSSDGGATWAPTCEAPAAATSSSNPAP